MRISFRVEQPDDGARLGPFLRRQGVSVARIRSLKYTADGLCVNGARAKTNLVLHGGDEVALLLPPDEPAFLSPEDIPLAVVYESPFAVVVDKPAGMVMHPTHAHPGGTLANAFAHFSQARGAPAAFRAVGRLDAGTSGLVLCALDAHSAQLFAKTLTKEYYAVVHGPMPKGPGCVDAPIEPAPGSLVVQRVSAAGRPCTTGYEVLFSSAELSFIHLVPRTGRTHQIRVHMAHIGHPLFGDTLYSGPEAQRAPSRRHMLHCAALTFREPGAALPTAVRAALPADMRALLLAHGCAGPAACAPVL